MDKFTEVIKKPLFQTCMHLMYHNTMHLHISNFVKYGEGSLF